MSSCSQKQKLAISETETSVFENENVFSKLMFSETKISDFKNEKSHLLDPAERFAVRDQRTALMSKKGLVLR